MRSIIKTSTSCLFIIACVLMLGMNAVGQENSSQRVARVINETGLSFTKASDNVWTVPYQGKARKDIIVVASVAGDLITLFSVVAEKKDLKPSPEMLQKLLKFNADFDRVKVGIDKDGDVFVRIDLSIRVLDKDEMTVNVDQVAAAADDIFKGLKPHFAAAK
ncbi:MAG: YbjN domain-containing protein [Acidobacteria bacterium]|nr:YbjN domain-containing protein [Acidobacteriota bacterium]